MAVDTICYAIGGGHQIVRYESFSIYPALISESLTFYDQAIPIICVQFSYPSNTLMSKPKVQPLTSGISSIPRIIQPLL